MKQELLLLLSEMRALAVAGMDGNSEAILFHMTQMSAGLPEFYRNPVQIALPFDQPASIGGIPVVDVSALRPNETLYTPKG